MLQLIVQLLTPGLAPRLVVHGARQRIAGAPWTDCDPAEADQHKSRRNSRAQLSVSMQTYCNRCADARVRICRTPRIHVKSDAYCLGAQGEAMAYQAAMMAEQERLAKAQKRNFEMASGSVGGSDDERDTKEEAWASVFASTSAAGAESAEEQRRRKLQRKTERRKEKAAAAEANVANFTAYVTGIPKEVVWTAVQTLFSKAGEVRRVKLYKDAAGEPKGDGLVTFATDAGLQAALSRDWALFGDTLTVSAAHLAEGDALRLKAARRTDDPPQVACLMMACLHADGMSACSC